MALHHGSLDRKQRDWVEEQLRHGTLRCVVCTSTLDLGVDFGPVERVLQIGSPKGVARLMQRAGRSGHAPGSTSRVTCVPAHAFELIEAAAAQAAAGSGAIEGRDPIDKPLDVRPARNQHRVLAGGFNADELLREVKSTHAYRELSTPEWEWVWIFITRGGSACGVSGVPQGRTPRWPIRGRDPRIARRHRMTIGTISDDATVLVRFMPANGSGPWKRASHRG